MLLHGSSPHTLHTISAADKLNTSRELDTYWPRCGISAPHSIGRHIHTLRFGPPSIQSAFGILSEALHLLDHVVAVRLLLQLHYDGIDGVGGICAWMLIGGETLSVFAEGPTVVC